MKNQNGFKNLHETFGQGLARRFRQIRIDRFGEGDLGLADLAKALGLKVATWKNFEIGVVMPAEILLNFIELTRVAPHWLLTGDGERYSGPDLEKPLFLGL